MYNYSIINYFSINENFESEYDNWNKIDRKGHFVLAEVSDSSLSIGLQKKDIIIDKSKLLRIKNRNTQINDYIIKQVPKILKKPILILKSSIGCGKIVVFGEVFDLNESPVLIAVQLSISENKKGVKKIYKVTNLYGKKDIDGIKNLIKNKDNILYVDNKKRTINWLNGLGIQLPALSNYSSFIKEILPHNTSVNKSIMIRDIPSSERPRQRALKYGVDKLSNEELISIIFKSGTKNYSVKMISNELLSNIKDISELKNMTINKLNKINGVGNVKALSLLAALELGKRVFYTVSKDSIKLNNSKIIFEYFKDLFEYENQECFYAIYLDAKSKLISYKLLFKGTLNTSCVHPREIFKYAFMESAYSIIVMHNHPSGDATPSDEDKKLTNSLMQIGIMCSIPIIDHIVFGKDEYFSFYEYMNTK